VVEDAHGNTALRRFVAKRAESMEVWLGPDSKAVTRVADTTGGVRGTWPLPAPYDFVETTRLLRLGVKDPTLRREPDGLWRTAHTGAGPVTVRLTVDATTLHAEAWGPGAEAVLPQVPRWAGLTEPAWVLPAHPAVDRLAREHRGLRLTDTGDVYEAVVRTVLQQRVTWEEAVMMWRRLCESLGAPAPGPTPVPMRLPPAPDAIRKAGPVRLQSAGIGLQQARTLMEVARVPNGLQRAAGLPTAEATALLQKVRGIGPWTAATVLGMYLGRPEPVPLGDFHLPSTIAWVLAGEPRATDARMLELLAPFDGQAARVVRLVHASRLAAPRRGPRPAWGPWRE
jgi:3-methyladenine DNA glycosylase/8-oxoguanine DNA glycosylase